MAKNNAINLDVTENADGFDLAGGTTERKLTLTGADITLTGAGSNTYTYPSATDTLVGRDSTDTLTNKTINTASNTITIIASDVSDFDTEVSNNSSVSTNTTHRGLTNDPHNVTASQVGLGNVSNVATDDTAYNATTWDTNTDSATKNAIRDKVETMDTAIGLNTSKNTNVTTNLSAGPRTATTIDVDSSDGNDATLVEADTTNAGILGSDKWDEIVANTNDRHASGSDDQDISGIGINETAIALNTTHRGLTNNPHSVDAADVNLGNVSNVATSDTAYNPTSWNTNTDAATKNAIRDKVETMDTAIGSNTSASHSNATDHASGSDDQDISGIGINATAIALNTTHRGSDGSDHSLSHAQSHDIASHSDTTATGAELETLTDGSDADALHDHAVNDAKISFTKSEIKGVINHGGTSGTSRPTGFDSVEWIGTVEPTNATNDDTWIDVT